jgi:CubicO group peptidase (beta-lactamase class C family)
MLDSMIRRRPLMTPWVAICALLVATPPIVAEEATESGAAALREKHGRAVTRFVEPFVDLAMFDGTILVDVGGEVVYSRSFGLANYEFGVGHDDRTRFRIASVSKTLTEAAFAVLIQREVLALDTPLSRYLPDFPSADTITIGHLLNHSSGIAHVNDLPWGDGNTSLGLDEIVARLARRRLDFDPGTDTSYSNGGYAVAAKVLEIAGQGSFAAVMRSAVFEPLGMADTDHISDARAMVRNMATGYQPGSSPGVRRHARFDAVEMRPGGGSFYSTVDDLLRFARSVFRDGFLDERLVRDVLGADQGPFLTQGRSPGFVAKLYVDRRRDVIVVSLANNYAVPADWAKTIADLATGETDVAPWTVIERSMEPVVADDPRLGRYRNSRGGDEVVIGRGDDGDLLLLDSDGGPPTALIPLADGGFLQPMYYQRCTQAVGSGSITCRILSGNRRYTSVLMPLDAPPPEPVE